ncbi:hypothetical protein GJAV_G00260010 [Gymnothorax javanicus]|nr:hypothetical protein GJAV_G00260010 [Gymnothorax javanicus]
MRGLLLCSLLFGIVRACSTVARGCQGAVDTHYAAEGQFFLMQRCVSPGNQGQNLTVIWSKDDDGSLDGTSSRIRNINGSLFFLPVHLSDHGHYTWRTSNASGAPSVERKILLSVTRGVCPQCSDMKSLQRGSTGRLHCGMKEVLAFDKSAECSWLKDCKPMNFHQKYIRISNVSDEDEGNYTCKIRFAFDGKKYSTAWTIQLRVKDEPALLDPKVIHPRNETIKVKPGVKAELDCKVFMGMNQEMADETVVYWLVNGSLIDFYSDLLRQIDEDSVGNTGIYRCSRLLLRRVQPQFFHVPFLCIVSNGLSRDSGLLWLAPAQERDLHLHIILCVAFSPVVVVAIIYRWLKVDVVLAYRRLRPFHSSRKNDDGYLYDACVSCVHRGALSSPELNSFCLQILPQVLEYHHGYNLFIRGRDDLPGEAVQDAISEAIQKSRRLIVVVSALGPEVRERQDVKMDVDRDGNECQPGFEHYIGLYDALVENRLKVILVEVGKGVDYSHFPASISYLRQKQGALTWRPSHGDPTAPPNSRFWKYLRYYMPHKITASTCTQPEPGTPFSLRGFTGAAH